VNQDLDQITKRAFKEVYDISVTENVNMWTAAYIFGMGRVAETKTEGCLSVREAITI
jgi:glutamate dehydrogenase/leucine dehydrogenase